MFRMLNKFLKRVYIKLCDIYEQHNCPSQSIIKEGDQRGENIVTMIVHKKILILFVQMLLKNSKCPLLDVHNKLGLGNYKMAYFTNGFSSKTSLII